MVGPSIMYRWSGAVKSKVFVLYLPPTRGLTLFGFLSLAARANVGGCTEHDSSASLNVEMRE